MAGQKTITGTFYETISEEDMISGMILLWSGEIAAIPAGYKLCDGTNGTPDLRDKFVICAGGTYAKGANANVSTHKHSTNIGHTHTTGTTPITPSGPGTALGSLVAYSGTPDSSTVSHLPPYYALAYIMKT